MEDKPNEEHKKIVKEELNKKEELKEKEKQSEEGINDGDSKSPIEEAKEYIEQLKEQNKIMAENLKKAEKMNAESILSGRSKMSREKSEEEKINEAAKGYLKDTGFDKLLFGDK